MALGTEPLFVQSERRAPAHEPVLEEFLQAAYRPHRALEDLLRALVGALAARAHCRSGSLRLQCGGTLVFERSEGRMAIDWQHTPAVRDGHVLAEHAVQAAERSTPPMHPAPNGRLRPAGPAAITASFPIRYAHLPLGELNVTWPADGSAGHSARLALCEAFAQRCALLVRRYDVQGWARQRLGRTLLLVGASPSLLQLERFIEKAAFSTLPVLLTGEFGTEKALAAAAIHCCGPHHDAPFVEVNCADAAGQPAQWFEQARGGTLFFNGIDELAPHLQVQLPLHMPSRLGQWLSRPEMHDLRVIAASTADLHERARHGGFSKALLVELDFLGATVPPLRERKEDIEALVLAALERQGASAEVLRSEVLLGLCKAHSWPGNLFELERVIARLAVMAGARPIHYGDVLSHAPGMAADRRGAPPVVPQSSPPPQAAEPPAAYALDADKLAQWVRRAMNRDPASLGRLHDGLRKALLHLGAHYAEAISLGELAQHAHVSPSHLSFLFRSVLDTSFKPLLQHIRIEKARQLLAADPRQRITEVALSVGFADLSHFEKSFRRIVGQSPRDYRRSAMG